jgi:tRNA (guanine37-N1)-methyltransferase
MLAAFTKLKTAQKVKKFLIKKNLLNRDYNIVKQFDSIYYPITKKANIPHSKVVNVKFSFPGKENLITVESLLENKLTQNQLKILPKSQEMVGKIMILEIPEKLKSKEKIIAEAYLKLNKNIETIVKKQKMHKGEFRLRKVKVLAGKKSKETTHIENGIKMKLHLEKTYFSSRLANERLRIAKKIKKGENVLVLFSGAAPYPLVLAKNSLAKSIVGVEINPLAHRYAVDNVQLNNFTKRVSVTLGNVRVILPKMKRKFDRIAMPLPKTGEEFLHVALPKTKKNAIIHLYMFLHDKDVKKELLRVKEICKNLKRPVKLLRKVKCGQFSPCTKRYCFDLKVL